MSKTDKFNATFGSLLGGKKQQANKQEPVINKLEQATEMMKMELAETDAPPAAKKKVTKKKKSDTEEKKSEPKRPTKETKKGRKPFTTMLNADLRKRLKVAAASSDGEFTVADLVEESISLNLKRRGL